VNEITGAGGAGGSLKALSSVLSAAVAPSGGAAVAHGSQYDSVNHSSQPLLSKQPQHSSMMQMGVAVSPKKVAKENRRTDSMSKQQEMCISLNLPDGFVAKSLNNMTLSPNLKKNVPKLRLDLIKRDYF
jgi:hypothetical protein